MNEDILKEIEQMRIACKQNDDKRDANLPLEIPEVTRIDDLSYGPDPKWHLLDLYLPKYTKKDSRHRAYSRWWLGIWHKGNLSILRHVFSQRRICLCEL